MNRKISFSVRQLIVVGVLLFAGILLLIITPWLKALAIGIFLLGATILYSSPSKKEKGPIILMVFSLLVILCNLDRDIYTLYSAPEETHLEWLGTQLLRYFSSFIVGGIVHTIAGIFPEESENVKEIANPLV